MPIIKTRPTSKREEPHKLQEMSAKPLFAPVASSSRTPKPSALTKSTTLTTKPQRPLTAYHIFFQIEREFIIQTTAGPNANGNDDSEKKLLRNVPNRYAAIKLRPDWYAGPGKRQKRKHRKSHGKIGFFELSSLISTRWATLEKKHADVKKFVHDIAARELYEYKEEMERWKLLAHSDSTSKKAAKKMSASKSKATAAGKISPPSSPKSSLDVNDINFSTTSICTDDEEEEDEVDYSISSLTCNGHHIPSPPSKSDIAKRKFDETNEDLAYLDPLFLLCEVASPRKRQRCVSPPAFPSINGYLLTV